MQSIWAVGLMTGTVLDGHIDVALIKTDGEGIEDFGTYTLAPYPQSIRNLLEETLNQARAWNFNGDEPVIFREAEEALTRAQSAAVRELVESHGLTMADIGAVGFHGQTVLHRAPQPDRLGQTRQLGDGELMHSILGTRVVYDFRSADMASGGQGAPLSAAYHAALLSKAGAGPDTAALNLGGVANITWQNADGGLIAFDTGPANAPLNDFVKSKGLGEMDEGGSLAAAGTVDENRLTELLKHPYLAAPYPKSLDRFDFGAAMADGMNSQDGAALLAAFTASAVGKALDLLPQRPKRLVVCGGGRHNPTIMEMLGPRAGVEAVPAETFGWSGDAVEAQCFAFLAVRVLRGMPISFPTTTGVPEPMLGGRVAG